MFTNPNYNFLPNYSGYPYTQNYNTSQPQPQSQPQQSSGINWVQGEAGAKSYALAPNQSILLMDSENNVFYIKSSDASGMPLPLRIFDYTERTTNKDEVINKLKSNYVTREELEKRLAEITSNGKQHIPTTK